MSTGLEPKSLGGGKTAFKASEEAVSALIKLHLEGAAVNQAGGQQ